MTLLEASQDRVGTQENPFAEHDLRSADEQPTAENEGGDARFAAWSETVSPFAETIGEQRDAGSAEHLVAEALAELRDESFDEAVAYLAEETEQAIADRFGDEVGYATEERERFGDAHLSGARFEAVQYLDRLEEGLAGLDLGSMSEQQLDEVLDRFDPEVHEVSPASEEFIGALVRKAKKAVKFVANAAKGVVSTVGKLAGGLLGPVLGRLKSIVPTLIKKVLQLAINRLPVAVRPAARALLARFGREAESIDESEAETDGFDEAESATTEASLSNVEALAESFDASLAEALIGEAAGEGEGFDSLDAGEEPSRAMEHLAEARSRLIDRIASSSDGEDLGPEIERFVPALLAALRIGINLVGRPKVVNLIGGWIKGLIRPLVGPQLSPMLGAAIADIGLRLMTLEAEGETGERADEHGAVAIASLVEDTVRQLAEQEDYVFEDEDLLSVATSTAFNRAVATNLPTRYVRPGLRQAPSLAGTFVTRRPRSVRSYRKYNRVPEIDLTEQIADALPGFGGQTVGASLRAAGATFPMRVRVHIYESRIGTSLPRMIRIDRGPGAARVSSAGLYPLTPRAATALFREPRLGVAVAAQFLRTRGRIAVGQRFYLLEPLDAAPGLTLAATRTSSARTAASHSWTTINLRRQRVVVGLYLSEADAQQVASVIRGGSAGPVLLAALVRSYRNADGTMAKPLGRMRVLREDAEDTEEFAMSRVRLLAPAVVGAFRRRLRSWVLPALAAWARTDREAFLRAVAHPDPGVTIRIVLSSVPGLGALAGAIRGGQAITPAGLLAVVGKPVVTISATPGRGHSKR
jgi:hypothetical protein